MGDSDDNLKKVPGIAGVWMKAIRDLGFPIVVAAILLWSHFTTMNRIVVTLERNNTLNERLERALWKVERKLGIEGDNR